MVSGQVMTPRGAWAASLESGMRFIAMGFRQRGARGAVQGTMRQALRHPCTDRLPRNCVANPNSLSGCSERRMGNLELLEQAFTLAESGEIETIDQLRQALIANGASV